MDAEPIDIQAAKRDLTDALRSHPVTLYPERAQEMVDSFAAAVWQQGYDDGWNDSASVEHDAGMPLTSNPHAKE